MYIRDDKIYLTQHDLKNAYNVIITYINQLKLDGKNIHLVGIARGSFNLIQELSNRCKLEYTILQYSTYDKDDKDVHFGFSSSKIEPNDILLIVDDIADTGNTVNKTMKYLQESFSWIPKIEVFTLVGSNVKFPEWKFVFEYNEEWIVFPYENNLIESCVNCLNGEVCNKNLNNIHCNLFNKSFNNNHSCVEFK